MILQIFWQEFSKVSECLVVKNPFLFSSSRSTFYIESESQQPAAFSGSSKYEVGSG